MVQCECMKWYVDISSYIVGAQHLFQVNDVNEILIYVYKGRS